MNKILSLRVVLIPMIVFIFIISIFFMIRGIWITADVLIQMLRGDLTFVHYSQENIKNAPSLMLLEAIDSFLLAFVFFIFSFGLFKIFFIKNESSANNSLPNWLHIDSIFELKSLLWHSVLTSLVVLFLNYAIITISGGGLNWNFLVFPGAILLISASLYFMKLTESKKEEK